MVTEAFIAAFSSHLLLVIGFHSSHQISAPMNTLAFTIDDYCLLSNRAINYTTMKAKQTDKEKLRNNSGKETCLVYYSSMSKGVLQASKPGMIFKIQSPLSSPTRQYLDRFLKTHICPVKHLTRIINIPWAKCPLCFKTGNDLPYNLRHPISTYKQYLDRH